MSTGAAPGGTEPPDRMKPIRYWLYVGISRHRLRFLEGFVGTTFFANIHPSIHLSYSWRRSAEKAGAIKNRPDRDFFATSKKFVTISLSLRRSHLRWYLSLKRIHQEILGSRDFARDDIFREIWRYFSTDLARGDISKNSADAISFKRMYQEILFETLLEKITLERSRSGRYLKLLVREAISLSRDDISQMMRSR